MKNGDGTDVEHHREPAAQGALVTAESHQSLVQATGPRGHADDLAGVQRTAARILLDPTLGAARTVQRALPDLGEHLQPSLKALQHAVQTCTDALKQGDDTRVQAKLVGQAEALDALFHHLAHRALGAGFMGQLEAFMRLALKAQSQSRATYEAAVHLRAPRATQFIQQQNVAVNQQVNNGANQGIDTNGPTRVLEALDGERLDTGETRKAGEANTALEALGAVDRTEDGSWQGEGSDEPLPGCNTPPAEADTPRSEAAGEAAAGGAQADMTY